MVALYPELAILFFRVTGAYATSAFLSGSWFNGLLAFLFTHVIILSQLGLTPLPDDASHLNYYVILPIFALVATFVAALLFWRLKLGELLPLQRYVWPEYGTPTPSFGFIFLNVIGWIAVAIVPSIIYESMFFTSPLLSTILVNVIPAASWIILWLIWGYGLPEEVIFGKKGEAVMRTAFFFGGAHIVMNTVLSIVLWSYTDFMAAWIAILCVAVLAFLSVVIISFAVGDGWVRPPRTGFLDSADLKGYRPTATKKSDAEEQEELGMESAFRSTAAVFNQSRTVGTGIFGGNKCD